MMPLLWIFYVCIIGAHAVHRRSHPMPIQLRENDTVLLPCYVEDQGVQTRVKWWREEILLADSFESSLLSPRRITMYSNGSLQVLHVQREDSGEYVCQVIRPAWGHVTQVHEIEVMYPPSVETIPASGELEVTLGENVDMQCVAKGVPTPTIDWKRKGKSIPLLTVRPQLKFRADDRNLSGRYTCVADNPIGTVEAHINLRIRHKPEIYMKEKWVHAYPGLQAKLNCTVIAWPKAKVEWYFENETFPYTSRKIKYDTGNDHSLLIKNIRTVDYGSYLCKASNILGSAEKFIELTAIANPASFKKESRNQASSTSYNFIWEVDSYHPVIEYQLWFRKYKEDAVDVWHKLYVPDDNDNISPVHTRSFNLTGLDAATHYEAVVLSRNRYGWSHPSEILRFHTKGASDLNENFETDGNQDLNKAPAVQLASMSQHPLTAVNESPYNQAKVLSLILSTLIIILIS